MLQGLCLATSCFQSGFAKLASLCWTLELDPFLGPTACGLPMAGGGGKPHLPVRCVQTSLLDLNLVLRRTAHAVRAPRRSCPWWLEHDEHWACLRSKITNKQKLGQANISNAQRLHSTKIYHSRKRLKEPEELDLTRGTRFVTSCDTT